MVEAVEEVGEVELPIWPPDGTSCSGCKFVHQMALLTLVVNLATRWCYSH